jgi:serine/threonine protein kinase
VVAQCRDIKSSNLLVNEHWVTKIGDFGTTRLSSLCIASRDRAASRGGEANSYVGARSIVDGAMTHTVGALTRRQARAQARVKGRGGWLSLRSLSFFLHPSLSAAGTLYWNAPEILSVQPYSSKADIYSMGIVMNEILTRDPLPYREPYDKMPVWDFRAEVQNGLRPQVPAGAPSDYVEWMTRCWAAEPARRPTAAQLVLAMEELCAATPVPPPFQRRTMFDSLASLA